jgi:hypothetical protein
LQEDFLCALFALSERSASASYCAVSGAADFFYKAKQTRWKTCRAAWLAMPEVGVRSGADSLQAVD